MNKQTILDRLDIPAFYSSELSGIQWNGPDTTKALCCFHEDTNPSLSLNQKTGAFYCFSCGTKGSIFDFVMKKHGLDFSGASAWLAEKAELVSETRYSLEQIKKQTPEGFKYDRHHVYKSGKPVYLKAIYKKDDKKTARYFTLISDNAYIPGRKAKPALYNQEMLSQEGPVCFPEGEKDCNSLSEMGFIAVTNGSVTDPLTPEMLELLKGRDVLVFQDEDPTGRECAKKKTRALQDIAASIKIIKLPGLLEKGDVSDYLQAGGTKEKLLEIVKETPEYELSDYSDIGGGQLDTSINTPFSYLKRGAYLQTLKIMIEWLIDKLLPKQGITLLHGKGGIGKTWLCLILADCISRGLPFMGLDTQTLPVIFVDFENSLPVLVDRVRKIGIDDVLFWHNADTALKPPKLDKEDWEQYKALPPGSLLIFDTLRASQGQDENDSRHMAGIMSKLKELRDMGFTILLLHHTPKGNDRTYKGSTAILDLADHVLSLHKVKKGNPEGGEVEDEDDTDCLYRLGTKDKTRYEPFHIFMAFDKAKGFVKAEDPAEEDLKTISERIEGKLPLNQSQIYDLVKDSPGLKGKGKVSSLLRKGEGKYWAFYKDGKKHIYTTVQLSTPIYTQTGQINNDTLNLSRTERTDTLFDTPQTLDTSHVSNCPDILQTDRTDTVIDLSNDDYEVIV